ncbi:type IX secretion system periplasmic lipoprotein PorW/SprE [Rhodocaloribacter sp.]
MMGRRLCLLGLMLVLAGCGGNSFVGRRFDNFTAYYNTFYNARKAFDRGVKALRRDEEAVNRDLYLPIFSDPDRASKSKDFEDAIKKSADVLRKHPDSKWVDDALLLIGKSYFYQQNYVGAEQKFQEVIDLESELEDEARFWQARTLIASEAYDEAAAHLQVSLAREGLDKKWASMLHLALGELYVKRANWEAAASELEQGLEHTPDKIVAARAQFLLGQVYETMGRYEDAVAAYKRVKKYNPLYELSYAAHYSAVRVEGLHGDGEAALKMLRKMERDDKNYSYRAELAYLRGRIYQAMGLGEDARESYLDLLYNDDPMMNAANVKGRIHYALGELYRDYFRDYVRAAAYFDTASVSIRPGGVSGRRSVGRTAKLDPNEFAPEAILDGEEEKEQFASYARVYREIARMDSLLELGSLDPEAFDARILELRKQRALELEERRRLREARRIEQRFQQGASNQQNFNPQAQGLPEGKIVPGINAPRSRGDAGFLYHRDPIRLQEARANFIDKWGDRPHVPNWRRLDAIRGRSEVAEEAEAETEQTPGVEGEATELPAIDLSGIPRDSLSQARMRAQRAMARYELANVLFLAIGRPDSAAAWYRKVIEEDGDEPVAQRAFYALAEVQRALGDTESARRLYQQVLDAYPDSDFAERVREHLGLEKSAASPVPDSLGRAERAYDEAYEAWQEGRYDGALNDMVRIAGQYHTTPITPRALLAAGAIYTEWAVRDSLDLFAPLPLDVPDSLLIRSGLWKLPETPADSAGVAADSLRGGASEGALSDGEADRSPAITTDSTQAMVADSTQAMVADSMQAMATDSTQAVAPDDTLTRASDTEAVSDSTQVTRDEPSPPAEPEPVRLTTLYGTLIADYARTPYAAQAREFLAVLEELRAAADTLAATDSLVVAEALMASDSLVTLPDSLSGVSDTLAVVPDTAFVAPEAVADEDASPPAEVEEGATEEPASPRLRGDDAALLKKRPGGAEVRKKGLFGRPVTNRKKPAADTTAVTEVLDTADKMPEPVGGMAAFLKTVRYPESAARAELEGDVVVRFVVDEQGRPGDVEVMSGIGAGCDEEAVRAVGTARFVPGEQDGKPVKVKMTLVIPFRRN